MEPVDGECVTNAEEGAGDVAFVAAAVLGGWADMPAIDAMGCHVVVLGWAGVMQTTTHVPGGARGLKAQVWRQAVRSCLVPTFWMAPHAEWRVVLGEIAFAGGGVMVFVPGGVFHRLLVMALHAPTMTTCPFLHVLTLHLVKRATQSSSQSWPMDVSDPDLRLSKTWPAFAVVERSVDNGKMALLVVLMFPWFLATWTEGPAWVWQMLAQRGSAAASRW